MSFRFARCILIFFHPVLMGLYLIVYKTIFNSILEFYPTLIVYFCGLLVLGYLVFPILTLYALHRFGYVKSFALTEKQDKTIAYLVFGVFYYLTFKVFVALAFFSLLQLYLLIPIIIVVSLLIINFFYEISAHALYMGSLIGFFIGFGYQFQQNYLFVILGLIFLSAWIISAQLTLKRYTPNQTYSGFFIGMSWFIFLFLFLLPS